MAITFSLLVIVFIVLSMKRRNTEVIVDTNIWYDIAEGKIEKKSFKNYNLVANYVNLDELSVTKKLKDKKSFDLVKKVVNKVYLEKSKMIIENPISYLVRLEYPKADLTRYEENYKGIIKFLDDLRHNRIPHSNISGIESIINNRKDELREAAKYFNEDMKSNRENVQSNIQSGNYGEETIRKSNSIDYTKDFIRYLVRSITKGKFELSDEFPWEKVELFLYTFDAYRKEYILSKWLFKPNDWYDLFILVYVDQKRKYWTNEMKWKKFIKLGGVEKYLV